MKKIIYSLSFISIAAVLVLSISLFAASPKKNVRTLYCRIINVTDKYIQVKKGKTEIVLFLAEDTKFIAPDGSENSKDIIEVCQYVDVTYTSEGTKKILKKIVIKKKSDCIK
jgi:hypothetical protein